MTTRRDDTTRATRPEIDAHCDTGDWVLITLRAKLERGSLWPGNYLVTDGGEESMIVGEDMVASVEPAPSAACMDCGRPYEGFEIDTVLPDDQWAEIHPEKDGVLCPGCIVQRAAALPGVIVAHMTIERSEPADAQ